MELQMEKMIAQKCEAHGNPKTRGRRPANGEDRALLSRDNTPINCREDEEDEGGQRRVGRGQEGTASREWQGEGEAATTSQA
eukprot:scaffold706_cov418-Prasinococcus_capsulatus_cf.AAC.35